MAERNGSDLRRRLRSADRFSERAMLRALLWLNTPWSRSSALLVRVTRPDQRRCVEVEFGRDLLLLLGALGDIRLTSFAASPRFWRDVIERFSRQPPSARA